MTLKKFISAILILIFSAPSFSARDNEVIQSLDELRLAQEQSQYLLNFSNLSTMDRERVRYIDLQLRKINVLLNNALQVGPQPPPNQPNPPPYQPPTQSRVQLFRSDSCSSELIGTIGPNTDCAVHFRNAARTWGISIDGICHDVADINSDRACEIFRNASAYDVKIYHSDTCSNELIASVNKYTDCQILSGQTRAWGIEVNGQCTDISDTDAVTACERFKSTN